MPPVRTQADLQDHRNKVSRRTIHHPFSPGRPSRS